MGIGKDVIGLIDTALEAIDVKFEGLKMCELGNQLMRFGKHKTAKQYFIARVVDHTSIDRNGKDGALIYDLSKPIIFKKAHIFDIVTNFGTSEHVENQEECFNNIDRLCRVGGAMVHAVPLKGYYKDHSPVHYTKDFFEKLAEEKNYRPIIIKTVKRRYNKALVCAVLVKR